MPKTSMSGLGRTRATARKTAGDAVAEDQNLNKITFKLCYILDLSTLSASRHKLFKIKN